MTIALSIMAIATIYGVLVLYAWIERERWRERAWECAQSLIYWRLEERCAEQRGDLLAAERCAHQADVYAKLSLGFAERSKRSVWRVW